jgi:hypothetical protein
VYSLNQARSAIPVAGFACHLTILRHDFRRATPANPRGGLMWLMVRVTFWLGLAILLLPPDPSAKPAGDPADVTGSVSAAKEAGGVTPLHGTLTPEDRAEPWRAPGKEKARRPA